MTFLRSDIQVLSELGAQHAGAYAAAQPFPHIVLDGLFDEHSVARLAESFPLPDDPAWKTYEAPHEAGKQEASTPEVWPVPVSEFLALLSSHEWVLFIEALSGYTGLMADSYGGGMHQSTVGARLDVHVDFNRHHRLDLDRLVNVIVYLNPGWTEEDGGCLELWNESRCVTSIVPIAGRCVVFSTSRRSFHGHPVPVADGSDPASGQLRRRRSIATYYYGIRPGARQSRHSTIWLDDNTGRAASTEIS